MVTTATRGIFRRVGSSVTSPRSNTVRKEVLIERPLDVLHIDPVELAPEILDEDGEVAEESTVPQDIPHKHPMTKEDPPANRIAHRELRIRVWSEGRPDGHHAGKTVTWSMAPLFVPPVQDEEEEDEDDASTDGRSSNHHVDRSNNHHSERTLPLTRMPLYAAPVQEGEEESDAVFRGDWAQAAAGHRDRFEAPAEFTATGFTRVSQEQATTIVDDTGHTAIRINLPPIAFNAARISVQLEGEDAAMEIIDLEVPGIIVIDPGHGGTTNERGSNANHATSHTSGILEKELTLDFGLRTRTALRALRVGENRNLRIHMTRDRDENRAGSVRANIGRDNGADILLSIHFNGFNSVARGTETLIRPRASNHNFDADTALAQRVNDAAYNAILAHDAGARNRGIKSERALAVLSEGDLGNTATWHPLRAALLEVEFIDNQTVDELLSVNEGYEQVRQDICDAVADALLEDLRRNS